MTGTETFKIPPLHGTLETLPEPECVPKVREGRVSVHACTYDFAMTSTNCPGTKWIAERVVPGSIGHRIVRTGDCGFTHRLVHVHLVSQGIP